MSEIAKVPAPQDMRLQAAETELRWTMWSLDELNKCEYGHATSTDYVLWGAIDPPGRKN